MPIVSLPRFQTNEPPALSNMSLHPNRNTFAQPLQTFAVLRYSMLSCCYIVSLVQNYTAAGKPGLLFLGTKTTRLRTTRFWNTKNTHQSIQGCPSTSQVLRMQCGAAVTMHHEVALLWLSTRGDVQKVKKSEVKLQQRACRDE